MKYPKLALTPNWFSQAKGLFFNKNIKDIWLKLLLPNDSVCTILKLVRSIYTSNLLDSFKKYIRRAVVSVVISILQ